MVLNKQKSFYNCYHLVSPHTEHPSTHCFNHITYEGSVNYILSLVRRNETIRTPSGIEPASSHIITVKYFNNILEHYPLPHPEHDSLIYLYILVTSVYLCTDILNPPCLLYVPPEWEYLPVSI